MTNQSGAQRLKYKKHKRPHVLSVDLEKLGKKMPIKQPNDKIISEWDNYQKRYGWEDATNRIKIMQIDRIARNYWDIGKDVPGAVLLDVGCNDGYITRQIAESCAKCIGVEPFVNLKDNKKPENVKWYRGTFNDYTKITQTRFDIILSLAVSIQLRDFGGLSEDQIVEAYWQLLAPGGIVIHETQKLQGRPNNIEHTNKMLDAYAKHFIILDKGKARASGGREYYHFKRIDRETDGI